MQLSSTIAASAVAACVLPPFSLASALPMTPAGDVQRVGPTRALTSISEGVAAADPGDVVLVDPATYAEDVNVAEGIAIVVDGGMATVEGRLTITGVPGGQQVLIVGLGVAPPQGPSMCLPEPAAAVINSRGAVHFQDCEIDGASGFGFCPGSGVGTEGAGGHALCAELAFDVVLQDCVLRGGRGGTAQSGLFSPPGGTGGSGLQLSGSSQVTLSSSSSTGGFGGFSTTGGTGGIGALLEGSSTLFAYGSTIGGGTGGDSLDLFEGDGGDGLVTTGQGSEAWLQMCVLSGGEPGRNGFLPGEPGEPTSGPLTLNLVDGAPCMLSAPNQVNDGQSWQIQADGVGVGGDASLLVAFRAAFRFAPAFERPLLVRWPASDALRYESVPAGGLGSVTYSFSPTPPPVGEDALIVWTQMICSDANGGSRFSEARAVVLLAAGV